MHNATDALTGQEDGQIDFICEAAEQGWSCRVADNEPGIATELLETVFVPFFSTKTGGSRIGLTLTQQIAIAHGGRVDARNRAEGGRR